MIPRQYVATGVMATPANALSRLALKGIIERRDLYSKEREEMPLEAVVERMRRDISFEEVSSGKFGVSFASADPAKAQVVTRDLMEGLGPDSILEAPGLPATPQGPNRAAVAGAGIVGGAAAGAVIAWIRRRRAG